MPIRMINVKEGECDEDPESSYPCELEDGPSHLYLAVDLWNLVDRKQGDVLLHFIKNEVEKPNGERRIIVTPALAQRIVEKLVGLEQALFCITDKYHRLREDTVRQVLAQDPLLVDSWREGEKTVYTLENNLQDVRNLQTFLQRAVSLGRELEIE